MSQSQWTKPLSQTEFTAQCQMWRATVFASSSTLGYAWSSETRVTEARPQPWMAGSVMPMQCRAGGTSPKTASAASSCAAR